MNIITVEISHYDAIAWLSAFLLRKLSATSKTQHDYWSDQVERLMQALDEDSQPAFDAPETRQVLNGR